MRKLFRSLVASALALTTLLGGTTIGTAQTATDTPTPSAAAAPAVSPAASPEATVAPTPFVSNVPCATDDPNQPGGVQRSERRGSDDDNDQGQDGDEFRTGNGVNAMVVHNCTDNRLRIRANIQLNTIPGRVVKPINEAYAESSCVHCQTLAIALQIDLYSSERANDIEPLNLAVALNTNCTGCFTVARAFQYVQGVDDDPSDVPDDVSQTVDELERELNSVQQDPDISLSDAEARLNSVLTRFTALGGSLGQQRDEKDS